jgi:cysteine desulfurase
MIREAAIGASEIYLDHNATTPLAAEVAEAMAEAYAAGHGNPGSQHRAGRRARQILEGARDAIGLLLGANMTGRRPDRVIFTSGGSEANNLAIFGLTGFGRMGPRPRSAQPESSAGETSRGIENPRTVEKHAVEKHYEIGTPDGIGGSATGELIVSALEHPSVLGPAAELEKRGWVVHRLGVSRDGVFDLNELATLLNPRTRLVSLMLGNNETGVLEPVDEAAALCRAAGVPLHTDASQVAGKLPIDLHALGVAAMTVTAHKLNGPVGIGALVVRHAAPIEPQIVGGFQQAGLRAGTESVALAIGFRRALELWTADVATHARRLRELRNRLESRLRVGWPRLVVNGSGAMRLPHVSNLAFRGVDRQAMLMALDLAALACSTGSACASGSSEPSHVLAAMGAEPEIISSSLRFSLGLTTTAEEIDAAVDRILLAAAACGADWRANACRAD